MTTSPTFPKLTDKELHYAATARCEKCHAGLAYPMDQRLSLKLRSWICSAVLKGEVPNDEAPLERTAGHTRLDWVMYKVRKETSINNQGAHTTRPPGTIAKTVGHAECMQCGHKWDSEPYVACGLNHHWFSGPCPSCGNDCGGAGTWSSDDARPRIEHRYSEVVMEDRADERPN